MKKFLAAAAAVVVMGWAGTASAAPFTISATLTGDPRPENPDNLLVKVTVTGDTTSNQTSWKVDLAMGAGSGENNAHPNAKLDAFYFGLVGLFTDYTLSNSAPAGWVLSPGNNANGSGSADFVFEVDKSQGNVDDVTNSVNLTFLLTKSSGSFSVNDFLNAPLVTTAAGTGRMGAHIQSLSIGGCTTCDTDSGFAVGNPGQDVVPVPEPTSMVLLGAALLGLARMRGRRQ